MDSTADWRLKFEREIHLAEEARARGNEGMARVCARRAAGLAAGEYLRIKALPSPGPSAYDRLAILRDLPSISSSAREAAAHLLTRVTTDWELPIQVDLISEARRLASELLEFGE